MDTLDRYRQIVRDALTEQTKIPYAHGEIEFEIVFDQERDRYLLMIVGRENHKRVHGCLLHLDIVGGKIWIQRDGTEDGIANQLVKAGVPNKHIVLAFRSSEVRQYTEFAVA
ncbi:MAG: XisI protein [Chloroflexi bacterium]|nr:XisI protein [Chloroflexota bacterium]MBI5051898.1 XisI protein [Chloroflexota bacterium]MBI5081803.1 XisI protein [Chloroflexota bacterium]MBI5348119.1 XisI protein [Chloroflexota bacterium]